MLIPMMVFFLALLVFGGLLSLFVMFEPLAAHSAAFPFAFFFAGLTAFALANVGGLVYEYASEPIGGVITMLIAPTLGLFGGGVFGYRLGRRYRHRRRGANDDA
jgi:hypothetical protein